MATQELNQDSFKSVLTKEGIVLIDFWAPWCGPCRMFGPVFERVSDEYPQMTFAKVNTEEQHELAAALDIRSIPTLMVLRDGVLVYRQPGALPQAALLKLIASIEQLDMAEVRSKLAAIEQRPAEVATA